MNEGFQMKQKYKDSLHLETLNLLRYCAFTTYSVTPTKKGFKKSKLTKFYPLRNDPKTEKITTIEIDEIKNRRELLITNGKKRGYQQSGTNAIYRYATGGEVIAYINNGIIEKVN